MIVTAVFLDGKSKVFTADFNEIPVIKGVQVNNQRPFFMSLTMFPGEVLTDKNKTYFINASVSSLSPKIGLAAINGEIVFKRHF